jgi:tetratricopeptide (TPR) repeat protein
VEDYCGDDASQGDVPGRRTALDDGRLAGLFLQLHRERFDGMLHVYSGQQMASVGFRQGCPVSFADPSQGQTLGEELVEAGLITRAQYTAVIARMTDGLVDDEAAAFCEHAIELGYLAEQDATSELSQRTHKRLIQVLGWTDCRTDIEPGEYTLTGRREFPQQPGALVYMGVRTFYEEEYLEQFFPNAARTYLRLVLAAQTISHFFGFDEDEFRWLRRLTAEAPVGGLLGDPDFERSHLLGLLLLLRLGEFGEVSNQPFQKPEREISGTRPTPTRPETSSLRVEPFQTRRPSGQIAAATPLIPQSDASDRSTADPRVRPRAPVSRPLTSPIDVVEQRPAGAYTRARERVSRPLTSPIDIVEQRPAAPQAPPRERVARPLTSPIDVVGQRPADPQIRQRALAPRPLTQPIEVSEPRPNDAAAAPRRPVIDATQEALLEAAARTAKARRPASPARRLPTQPIVTKPETPANPAAATRSPSSTSNEAASRSEVRTQAPQAAQPQLDYAKAHLNELIARRKNNGPGGLDTSSGSKRDVERDLQKARDMMRDQQFVRAEEILRVALTQEPENLTLQVNHGWARLRAQPPGDEKQLAELRELAKKLMQEPEQLAFASYVLGHVYFSAKRDDLAEKFFRKALATDRNNKDAERHVLILERRKQLHADADAAANRKLFGIQLSNSKPKT